MRHISGCNFEIPICSLLLACVAKRVCAEGSNLGGSPFDLDVVLGGPTFEPKPDRLLIVIYVLYACYTPIIYGVLRIYISIDGQVIYCTCLEGLTQIELFGSLQSVGVLLRNVRDSRSIRVGIRACLLRLS
jgi:hypothetical protein